MYQFGVENLGKETMNNIGNHVVLVGNKAGEISALATVKALEAGDAALGAEYIFFHQNSKFFH